MDFKEQIKIIGANVDKLKDGILTEEATKNAFIMPFIQALGYNVFNPLEVVPEYTTDIGIKQGEKIDYAIFKNNQPIILIECKKVGVELNLDNESQLFRYFHASPAKFAILTNGLSYKFYTDLEEPNKMDSVPFLSFSINKIKDAHIAELKKFHKDTFDCENIINSASDLKYSNEIRKIIISEMANPTEDFVRYFAKKVYSGVATKKVIDQFTALVKKTFLQYINDSVTERLQTALNKENEKQEVKEIQSPEVEVSKIVTTEEELDAFRIVRAIACAVAPLDRIYYRDAQSYFSVLFDDNRLKPICRLCLCETKKYIIILDKDKNEEKFIIDGIEDIYKYSDKIIEVSKHYASM